MRSVLFVLTVLLTSLAFADNQSSTEVSEVMANCQARAEWAVRNHAIRDGFNKPALNDNRIRVNGSEAYVDKNDPSQIIVIVFTQTIEDYLVIPGQEYFLCKDGKIVE